MRCVITGVDPGGGSYVMTDTEIDEPELGIALVTMDPDRAAELIALVPHSDGPLAPIPPSGVHCMFVRIPGRNSPPPPPMPGVDGDGFHTTPTIDYVVVVAGQLELRLDHSAVVLGPGDLVVQQATRHAWRSATESDASFIAVMTAAPAVRG
jgi:hypothetical protein